LLALRQNWALKSGLLRKIHSQAASPTKGSSETPWGCGTRRGRTRLPRNSASLHVFRACRSANAHLSDGSRWSTCLPCGRLFGVKKRRR